MRVHYADGDPPVRIGRYCSIHETVTLVTGSEHPTDAVTTFFFYWKMGVGTPEQPGTAARSRSATTCGRGGMHWSPAARW